MDFSSSSNHRSLVFKDLPNTQNNFDEGRNITRDRFTSRNHNTKLFIKPSNNTKSLGLEELSNGIQDIEIPIFNVNRKNSKDDSSSQIFESSNRNENNRSQIIF